MFTRRLSCACGLLALLVAVEASARAGTDFQVGAADKDITPPAGRPYVGLWGTPRKAR